MKVLNHITRVDNVKDIPCWCGAFILNMEYGDYVGASSNLKKEIYRYKLRFRDVKQIQLFITDTVECAFRLEDDLILDLQPSINKIGKKIICYNGHIKRLKGIENAIENAKKIENSKNKQLSRSPKNRQDSTKPCYFFRRSSSSCTINRKKFCVCKDYKFW